VFPGILMKAKPIGVMTMIYEMVVLKIGVNLK
jgi:hypothetical protein